MNLVELIEELDGMPQDMPLVFTTEDGEIGGGYHVTELKLSDVTGIDCGAGIDRWSETSLQLLDGGGGTHMAVGKIVGILRQSVSRVEGLASAPVHVEFAPGNAGLRRYEVADPAIEDARVLVRLREDRAVCKPADRAGRGCTGKASAPTDSCCGTSDAGAKDSCCA